MGRWLRQTDTLIILALAIGLFVFRFGNETWVALSPHLSHAKNTLTAQFEKMTTSLTSPVVSVEPPDNINVTSQVTNPIMPPVFTTAPRSTRVVVGPNCPSGYYSSCQY